MSQEDFKQMAISIILEFQQVLRENYKDTALVLNACSVARERYATANHIEALDITGNIPDQFRTFIEFESRYKPEQLVEQYATNIVRKISSDYIITTISTLDAFCEELYKKHLSLTDKSLNKEQVGKKIQSMWTNDNFRNYLVPLLVPTSKMKEEGLAPSLWLDSYEELRIVRHALIHTRGKLSTKHQTVLRKIKQRDSKRPSILDSRFVKNGNEVLLDYEIIIMVRKWALEFAGYVSGCVAGIGAEQS